MNLGFWKKLEKPIFVLAPMADVTDAAFRRIIAKYGKPDVMWTEFVSADGLTSPGREVLLNDLKFTEGERPIVAQLFSGHPEKMREAAKLCADLGFDGIDINMGCPDKTIEKQYAGAGLIKNPKLAKEIIRAAKEGAPSLPISVKTRTGYSHDEIDTWIPALLEEDIAVLTIHARTRKEMSLVPARWQDVARVVKIRDEMKKDTLIFGNGDVEDLADAREKVQLSGADGAMLGRAIFGNPFLFSYSQEYENRNKPVVIKKYLEVMVEHTKLYEELLGGIKSFAIMKKHYKAYVNGFEGAKELRMELMEAVDAKKVETVVKKFLSIGI